MNNQKLDVLITQALREDAANKDITTNVLIPSNHVSEAAIIVNQEAVICGLALAKRVFQKLSPQIRFQTTFKDGANIAPGTQIATLKGKTRALLTGERTALNFLGHLCGIATKTYQFVQKTRQSKAQIFDTRKTTPGLRMLEKYAVTCGGGHNHRFDLENFVLIKDNHREACSPHLSIPQAIDRVREKTKKLIEIEVDNLTQFKQALSAHPDIILLDNMSCALMMKAVTMTYTIARNKRPQLEASGGITLSNITAVAKTGIDRISIGSLTHSHNAVDINMELTK